MPIQLGAIRLIKNNEVIFGKYNAPFLIQK